MCEIYLNKQILHKSINVMSSLVLGIGVGSFILVSTWIVAFILCLVAIRTRKIIGVAALITAIALTVILILIPKQSKGETTPEKKESDYNFIWHNLLATFLGLCSVGSIVLLFTEFAIEPIKPTRIRSWIE